MKRAKLVLIIIIIGFVSNPLNGTAQIQEAKDALSNIYKKYDSLNYLTFDVLYSYNSDTLYGDFTKDEIKSSYTMNGKKAFYTLGDIDFMQNESFLIAIYHKEKFMIVGDPQQNNAGGYLPMRAQMDSLFKMAEWHYSVNLSSIVDTTNEITTSTITLLANDSIRQFNKYVITYDSSTSLLKSLQYSFMGKTDNYAAYDTSGDQNRRILLDVPRKKQLTIQFLNYRFDNISKEIYDENSYIFYEDGVYKPVSKFADFKLYYTRTKK